MTPPDKTPTSRADAARSLAEAKESASRLEGALSTGEGWWTIGSAALALVIISGALRTGQGVGYGYMLVVPTAAVILARYRRSAERVHPRKYQLWYSMASVWCLVFGVAGGWYWLIWDPQGPRPVWLTCAVALVAALPLALVGGRLVAGSRSR